MALWQEPDYGILADRACWAMFAITAVVVGLRIFCRVFYGSTLSGGGLGLDDYITLVCMAVFLATCILVTLGSSHGLGRHMATLDEVTELPLALKYNVIVSAVLIWSFSMPKFAVISILKRILNYGTKTTIVFWSLALSSQACVLATSIWWFKQCTPVEYGWNKSIKGHCANVSVLADLGYFTSAYSGFLDIFFALYPIPLIMRLNMPLKNRILVSTALGLTVLACVVSIYKLTIFGQVFAILAVDATYPVPYLDILGVAEGFVLLVCSSLPTLGPLFRATKSKIATASRSAKGSHNRLDDGGMGSNGNSQRGDWHSSNSRAKRDNVDDTGNDSVLNLRPSFDAIPLVKTGVHETDRKYECTEPGSINKTMEVSVSSESFASKNQTTTRSAV